MSTGAGPREDEVALWGAVLAGERPREAGARLGIHRKRVWYLCEKWANQGRYDYGVSCDIGWPVRYLVRGPDDADTPTHDEGRT